jgi:hypothetical protein
MRFEGGLDALALKQVYSLRFPSPPLAALHSTPAPSPTPSAPINDPLHAMLFSGESRHESESEDGKGTV